MNYAQPFPAAAPYTSSTSSSCSSYLALFFFFRGAFFHLPRQVMRQHDRRVDVKAIREEEEEEVEGEERGKEEAATA